MDYRDTLWYRCDVPETPLTRMLLGTRKAIIAGGYARFLIMGERFPSFEAPPPGDCDLFVYGGEDPRGVRMVLELAGWSLKHQARSGSAIYYHPMHDLNVQVVWQERDGLLWPDPQSVVQSFSFTTEQFALLRNDNGQLQGAYNLQATGDTLSKRLVVNRIIDPARVLYRMNKYGRKGYTVDLSVVQDVLDDYLERSEDDRHMMRAGNRLIAISSDPEE